KSETAGRRGSGESSIISKSLYLYRKRFLNQRTTRMKILSAIQMKQADAHTTVRQQISSLDLMERASNAIFEQLTADFKDFKGSFTILCGAGNNGGDGLAL